MASQPRQAGQKGISNPERKKVTFQKERADDKNHQKKPAKRLTNSQSAVKPGNETGFKTKKGNDAIVQFGPIVNEFLSSKELVNKRLVIVYDQPENKLSVDFTFCSVLANGVSVDKPKTLNLDDYMAQRNKILKKSDAKSLFVDFATILLERLGVDVTQAKPNVEIRSVRDFIMKHLSPVERVIVQLDKDEYDRIDTTKIPDVLKPTLDVVSKAYGGLEERSVYLVTQINSTDPKPDVQPPNWLANGVVGMSKGLLLENLKVQKAVLLGEDQKQSLLLMKKALGILEEEEEKKPEENAQDII